MLRFPLMRQYCIVILSLFKIPSDNPDLLQSQMMAFSKQVPLLYFILLVNAGFVAATHFGSAPLVLSVYLPAIFGALCVYRLISWRLTGFRRFTHAEAVQRLTLTMRLTSGLGACYTAWALALFPYGDAYAQGHVAFFMAITVIGCIFCLMHVRAAALMLSCVVLIPFTIFFISTKNTVFVLIAINVMLVAIAMIFILMISYRDFAKLIAFQKELVAKQRETQRLSDDNFRLANLDSLTDLSNRRQFFAELAASLETARSNDLRFGLGLIDLDGFKPVNDIYGHAIGDRVLVETANRLRKVCGSQVFVARLGGDEFALILSANLLDADVARLGEAVTQALQQPYVIRDINVQVPGSVGFAMFPDAAQDAEHLFERADYALYYAKQNKRGNVVLFSSAHEKEIRESRVIEQTLRNADLDRELSLAFQPIVDVKACRTVAFEALARWNSALLGPVSPGMFIKVAERSDLICQLTEILFRKMCEAAQSLPGHIRVSFNLSARDIVSRVAVERIIDILEESGIDPDRVDLEVTETVLMQDFEQAFESLRVLKECGIRISLDDFGTGFSSLSYVHRLPLDKIKIDRSFVMDIETAPACRDIVKTITDLCRNLRLNCVVEGTETLEQIRILRDLGCTLMQGYYFSKPMPGEAVAEFLRTEHRRFESLAAMPPLRLIA